MFSTGATRFGLLGVSVRFPIPHFPAAEPDFQYPGKLIPEMHLDLSWILLSFKGYDAFIL
jgi:hypothetical protein